MGGQIFLYLLITKKNTMINSAATYTISLDTRRARKDGTYPVKLRVFFKKQKKRYSTNLSISEEDFRLAYIERPISQKHKKLRKQIRELEQQINEILEGIGVFTFEKFESRIQTKSAENDLFSMFDLYEQKLRTEKRINSANSYKQAKKAIQKYTKKQNLPFEEVDVKFLNKLEKQMMNDGRSSSTVGIYARNIRSLFNQAIQEGFVKEDYYPFGRGKYQIPHTPKTYKALSIEQVGLLLEAEVEPDSSEEFFRDLWFFSYFGNGINTKDMVLIKYSNIKDNVIQFKRAKTLLTNKTAPEGQIQIIEPLQAIIDKWGNPRSNQNYLLPILTSGISDEEIAKRVSQTNKQIRKYINRIGQRVGITEHITTQHARHSFATVMALSGVPLAVISQKLTHGNISTTDKYIGRIDSLKDMEISNLLIPKKTKPKTD